MSDVAARTRSQRLVGARPDGMGNRLRERDNADIAGHLIRRAKQIIVSIFMEETAGFDITPLQFGVLTFIGRHPGIDQTGLSRRYAMDRSTTTEVVRRLIDKGWLDRSQDPNDRRTKRLRLTDTAHDLVNQVIPASEHAQARSLAPLTKREQAQFLRLLSKLVRVNNRYSRVPQSEEGFESEHRWS